LRGRFQSPRHGFRTGQRGGALRWGRGPCPNQRCRAITGVAVGENVSGYPVCRSLGRASCDRAENASPGLASPRHIQSHLLRGNGSGLCPPPRHGPLGWAAGATRGGGTHAPTVQRRGYDGRGAGGVECSKSLAQASRRASQGSSCRCAIMAIRRRDADQGATRPPSWRSPRRPIKVGW